MQVLGAGQLNGQFAVFDTRRGVHAVDSTLAERSHRQISHCLMLMYCHVESELRATDVGLSLVRLL